MDAVTTMTIDRGRKNNQLLNQAQYRPMPVAQQIALLYFGTLAEGPSDDRIENEIRQVAADIAAQYK